MMPIVILAEPYPILQMLSLLHTPNAEPTPYSECLKILERILKKNCIVGFVDNHALILGSTS